MAPWSKAGLIGVDVGTRTLKGISLTKSKGKVWLENYFFHDLADGNELYPLDAPVFECLRAMIEVKGFKGYRAASCLFDREVIIHDMILPQMPKADLDLAIQNEMEEQFALRTAEACFDHVVIGPAPEGHGTALVYKIYGSKSASVQKLDQMLKDLTLKPVSIESSILAQIAALSFNGYLKAAEDNVLIDIGESRISVSLLSGVKMVVCNILNTGFGNINQVLFESQGLAYDKAENLKLTYNMEASETEADESHQQIDEILSEIFYKIQRLVAAYRMRSRSKTIARLLVTGGGSQLKMVTQALQTYCEVAAEVVNPFRNIEIYRPGKVQDTKIVTVAPYMTTAVGLALRGT